ncbi:DUF1194 domain-containing protein [Roseococcus suduntuyensis]|uniref:VWFA domain-containing protein n=1 Tax=Roseococcus suduntuyensis TaxID=455361 RepID=A0A840A5Z7_9PROT|nr:DUF1194 domain-containing protein [Roseococcus suduntuyensis]MBB3896577.1 hypothetical protein [Roseococcus suduntuyensis]
MEPVDVALVLAVDVSASVDFQEFALMIGGLSAAFRDPSVLAAATGGPRGAAALSAVFWSDTAEPAAPWTRIQNAASADGFATLLEEAPRLPRPGATALGDGMVAGLTLLARCPAPATRSVMDVSGDGRSNRGRPPGPVRDLGVAAGVTINGLAVLDEEPDLLEHYETEVIGGPGAFAMSCADYADFVEAIRRKLIRELRGPGLLVV